MRPMPKDYVAGAAAGGAVTPQICGMELRPYQQQAVSVLSRRRRCLVIAPAGSGKTVIMASAIEAVISAKVRTTRPKILWLANTTEQCQQADRALAGVKSKADVNVHCVAGVEPGDAANYDLVVFDECHYLRRAKSWQAIADQVTGAMWGCTATPWGEGADAAEQNDRLINYFGGNIHRVERRAVADILAPVSLKWIISPYPRHHERIPDEIERAVTRLARTWQGPPHMLRVTTAWRIVQERGIIGNEQRTQWIIDEIRKRDGAQTLVLVPTIKYGAAIAEETRGVLVHSSMPKLQRERAMRDFKAGKLSQMIATSLADEGLDLPNAEVLIQCGGGRSSARTEQRAGRVMRQMAGKRGALIVDVWDAWHPMAASHSANRRRIYLALGAAEQQRPDGAG